MKYNNPLSQKDTRFTSQPFDTEEDHRYISPRIDHSGPRFVCIDCLEHRPNKQSQD